MKDNSLYKFGGIASVLVGITFLVIGIPSVIIPSKLDSVPDIQSPDWISNFSVVQYDWKDTLMELFPIGVHSSLISGISGRN